MRSKNFGYTTERLSLLKFHYKTMNQIKTFRIVSTLEAISFLVLLLIAMPLKYAFDLPQYVQMVGWGHGILFILYVAGAFIMAKKLNWSPKVLLITLACSLIPFGPFYVEKHYLPKRA